MISSKTASQKGRNTRSTWPYMTPCNGKVIFLTPIFSTPGPISSLEGQWTKILAALTCWCFSNLNSLVISRSISYRKNLEKMDVVTRNSRNETTKRRGQMTFSKKDKDNTKTASKVFSYSFSVLIAWWSTHLPKKTVCRKAYGVKICKVTHTHKESFLKAIRSIQKT